MKKCNKCGVEKSFSEFQPNKKYKDGYKTWCKPCESEYNEKYHKQHADKRVTYTKEWHLNNPEAKKQHKLNGRNTWLQQQYGIDLDTYNKMLFEQNGCCAICGLHHSEENKALAVDHCHTTGKVRGLLCINCNHMLGKAKDNVETLKAAIKYLKDA